LERHHREEGTTCNNNISFLEVVQDFSQVVSGAENFYRDSLIELENKIIHNRIDSDETRWYESGFKQAKVIQSLLGSKDRNTYPDVKAFESPEENRKKLKQAYGEVAGTIYQMETEQLLDFITRLRSDLLLIRVLHSLAKKRISQIYKPDRYYPCVPASDRVTSK
jgi:hypothetical protein